MKAELTLAISVLLLLKFIPLLGTAIDASYSLPEEELFSKTATLIVRFENFNMFLRMECVVFEDDLRKCNQ